jgi:hypothetical protein
MIDWEGPRSKRGVPLVYCSNTLTEAQFFGKIRSALRRLSIKWKPRTDFLKERQQPYTGKNKRIKWQYKCDGCKKAYPLKEMECDHKTPCGSLRRFDDIGPFVQKLLCEKDGYQLLCKKKCHLKKTNQSRRN